MASKQSPAKVTLGMIKGKPITTSVPVIKYHASDDELEELYPSTDEEKPKTPESERTSPKSSPFKIKKLKSDSTESNEDLGEQRSSSLDLSEGGTPPSDPWKVLSDIRGKITKTFEEKLSEIKSEKKNKTRSRENSSVSDPEDLGDVTPTEDVSEKVDKAEKESPSPSKSSKPSKSHRFRFSNIKTGLKAKDKAREESIESGVEAAELVEVDSMSQSNISRGQETSEISSTCTVKHLAYSRLINDPVRQPVREFSKPGVIITELKSYLLSRIFGLLVFLGLISYLVPILALATGIFAGSVVVITVQRMISRVSKVVAMPVEIEDSQKLGTVPVLEIPAVEEYAVVDKFEGWLNELPYNYDPENYHVARTQSVYFKLEGDSLRVSETRTRIPKRAVWNEPQPTAKFTRRRVYSLVGAKVELLPEGLTRRRRWSKKYPICVTLGREGVVENITLETPSDDELLTENEKDKLIVEEDETDDDLSFSKDTKDVFEDCHDDVEDLRSKLFFFGRTDRQKEDWYRRLVLATRSLNKRNSIPSTKELTSSSSNLSLSQASSDPKNSTTVPINVDIPPELSFHSYMSRYADTSTPTDSSGSLSEVEVLWLNALFGRILFDLHKSPDMINVLQDKIQRKLSNIKLPYFMESLMISELVIGQGAPFIHKATKPVVDERGLWIDLNVTYECGLTMTVETKLNLMKLTRAGSVVNNPNDSNGNESPKPAKSPMFDSDVEDSPETSTEDEESINVPASTRESTPSQSSGRKFLSMVDKLAANKYFQHAAELTYVRRAMEGVSNTEIRLMVSVSSIEGCLSINIPPPPSDRVWYGFKPIPKINLDARPAVGERAVNIGYVTNWIKTKLLKEFDKIVVLPNMDDLVIPLAPNYPYQTSTI